jgi:hypothetical protein
MCTYLTERNSTYYFRRVIPIELRSAFNGRTEFMVSLRTKVREDAKRLIPSHTIETDKRLGEAQAGLGAVPRAADVPPSAISPWLSQSAMEWAEEAAQDEAERQARWEARAPLREKLDRAFRLSTAQITPEEAAVRDMMGDREYEMTVRIIQRNSSSERKPATPIPKGKGVASHRVEPAWCRTSTRRRS